MTPEEIFSRLGFNSLESEVYIALLKNGPQTAYKIGKLLGKPTANVYKAVDVLSAQGAIEVMETDVKTCKAIPIQSVVKQMEQAYRTKTEMAVNVLGNLYEEKSEEGIFKLKTIESVLQRATEMFQRTESIIAIDAFPNLLELISPEINRMSERGVQVYLQAYSSINLDARVSKVIPSVSEEVIDYWDAEQLNIVADGKEMLLSLFSKDLSKLIQATYSNNLYISCCMHAGIMSEHKVHRFSNAQTMDEIESIRKGQKFFLNSKVPGLETLFSQYKIPGSNDI